MERLTKRDKDGKPFIPNKDYRTDIKINGYDDGFMDILKRLAELEDKLESGQLVELPCKIYDTVWVVFSPSYGEYEIHEAKAVGFEIGVNGIRIITNFCCYECYRICNYTTKEAAEARLKELQEKL